MLLILAALSVMFALIWAHFLPSAYLSLPLSICSASLAFYLLASSHFGWLDRVFYENLAITLLVSGAVCGVTDFLVRKRLKGKPHES